jgi:hypothetical protein
VRSERKERNFGIPTKKEMESKRMKEYIDLIRT